MGKRASAKFFAVAAATATVAVFLAAQSGQPAVDPALKDVRVALRFGPGQVLLVGSEITGPSTTNGILYDRSMEELAKPTQHAVLGPGDLVYLAPPEYMARFKLQSEEKWRVGDRWKVYPGAGPPVTVVIQSLAFSLICGGIGGNAAAIARFEDAGAANRIAGLRASEYLAAPDDRLGAVSEEPLMPVDNTQESESIGRLEQLLLGQGRALVRSADWETNRPVRDKTWLDRIRRMNQTFLTDSGLKFEVRCLRWSLPGRKPLLFVQAVWRDRNNLAVFACRAVVEEGEAPAVLWFDAHDAEEMRVEEYGGEWMPDAEGAFRNAWRIGGRTFVLTYLRGYEGYQVQTMELVPGKGLAPAGPAFGDGC
jgi:hypothetical protein